MKNQQKHRPLILANKLYVPHHLVERIDLEKWSYDWVETLWREVVDEYGVVQYKPDKDEPQVEPYEVDRHLVTCERVYTGMGDYYSFPRGHMAKLTSYLRQNNLVDLRNVPSLDFTLKMKRKTVNDPRWEAQLRCIQGWYKKGGGVVQATTGSGKTVIGIGMIAKMRLRTILFSKRKDAYKQWRSEIYLHTNLAQWEKKLGRPLLGEYKTTRKKRIFPITIATVQTFTSNKGKRKLAEIQDQFGLVLLDEAHELCTPEFSRPILFTNPLLYGALTATPQRTDNRNLLLFDMVGPVVAVNETAQMPPEVTFIMTGEEVPTWLNRKPYDRRYKWTASLTSISRSVGRLDIIERWIRHDVERKRTVAAYSERRQIIQSLRDRLKKDDYKVAYVDGSTKNRDQIYEDFCAGKYDVLLAGKVLDALVNLPEMDCLHVCTPVNKETQILQIYGRARRIKKGKNNTEIRYYVDHGGQLSGAYKNNRRICKEQGWVICEEDTRVSMGADKWVHPLKRKNEHD